MTSHPQLLMNKQTKTSRGK